MPRQPIRAAPPPPIERLDNASHTNTSSSLNRNNNTLSSSRPPPDNISNKDVRLSLKPTVIRPSSTTNKKKKAPPPRPAPPKRYQPKPDLLDHLNFEHECEDLLESHTVLAAPPKKFLGVSSFKKGSSTTGTNANKKKFAPLLPQVQTPSATLIDLSTPPKSNVAQPSSVLCPPNKTLLDMDNPDVLPHVPLLDMAGSIPSLLPSVTPSASLGLPLLPSPAIPIPSHSKSTTSIVSSAPAPSSIHTHRHLQEDASPFVRLHQSIAPKVAERKDSFKEKISHRTSSSLSVTKASISSCVSSSSLGHLPVHSNVLCPSKINLVAPSYSSKLERDNLFKADYDFPGEEEGDLSLQVGDEVTFIHKINEDWWFGECRGRQGQFPANFVSPLATEESKSEPVSKEKLPLAPSAKVSLETTRKVVALYDFPGEEPGDLAFDAGAQITVLREINEDWLFGELNGVQGQFPANFVQDSSPSSEKSRRGSREEQSSPPLGIFVAQYDFPAEQPDDLELKVGDRILVTECINQDWWRGMITPAGRSGIFPANFVTRLES